MNEKEINFEFERLLKRSNKLTKSFWKETKLRNRAFKNCKTPDEEILAKANEINRNSIEAFNEFKGEFDSFIEKLKTKSNLINTENYPSQNLNKIKVGSTQFNFRENDHIYRANTGNYVNKAPIGYNL